MSKPIDVDIPHKLGRAEARRRLADNIGKLSDHIPGGASHVTSSWAGDTLSLTVAAMGQSVDAQIDVEETKVHARIILPGGDIIGGGVEPWHRILRLGRHGEEHQ